MDSFLNSFYHNNPIKMSRGGDKPSPELDISVLNGEI